MLLAGALVGWLASLIMNTDQQMGAVANIIVGVLGAMLGAFLYGLLFNGNASFSTAFLNFSVQGLIISIIGAVALIGILKMTRKTNVL